MDISVKIDTPRSRGSKYNLAHRVASILRMRGGTLIGIPDNALGSGNPNLLGSPEFAGGLVDAPTRTGLVALSSIAGYDNALAFGHDGSTLTLAYKNFTPVVGLTYTVSATVKMDDGLAPTFASPPSASSANTFAFVFANDPYLPTIVAANSDGTYRVSATVAAPSTLSGLGVIKYPANNNRTFKVTGYKLELGSVATPYTPQSILRQRGTYQDSTGTMALSTVGEVLGLLTDRLGTVGPELLSGVWNNSYTNTFDTFSSTTSGGFTGTTVGAKTNVRVFVPFSGVIGDLHQLRMNIVMTGATCKLLMFSTGHSGVQYIRGASGVDPGVVSGDLFVTCALTVSGANGFMLGFDTQAGGSVSVSLASACKVTGNHATQPTPANKPTLVRVPKRLGPNLVRNGTFDSGTTEWTQIGGVSQSASGGVLTVTSVGSAGGSFQDVLTQATTVKITVRARSVSGSGSQIWGLAQTGGFANPTVAAVYSTSWQDYPLVVNRISGASGVRVYITAQTNPGAIEVDSVEVQEVLEWTNAISFNGSGQSLITPLATGNEGWLCAAVTFGGASGVNETIFANGAGAAAQKGVWLTRNGQGGGEDYFRMGVGNGTELAMVTTIFPRLRGTPRVVEGGWTASSVFVGVDGNISSTTRTGDATPAPNPSLIGAYLPTTHVLNGPMTAFLHCQTVPTEAERDLIRKWMASTNRAPYWGELPTLNLDFVSGDYLISNGEV